MDRSGAPGYLPSMTYRTRKRLALLTLVVGLPLYVALALWLVSLFDRPPILVELLIYVALGVLWAIPLKRVFLGVGKADPDAPGADGRR
jgi:Protein of unknown function (DUF2842).